MSPCRVNQTFYLVVLVVTLSCIIIISPSPSEAHEASPSASNTPLPHRSNNSTENEGSFSILDLVNRLFLPPLWFLWWCIATPIGFLYTVFFYTPSAYVWKVISLFFPLIAFFSVAALLGVCVGATAGWFSEVIIGVLTAPSNDELASAELENKKRVAKLRRRAAALANLKARNGGRIPEEFYGRQGGNSRMNISQRSMLLDGYGSDYRKNYSVGGRGVRESAFSRQEE